jgi:hypothetical protein
MHQQSLPMMTQTAMTEMRSHRWTMLIPETRTARMRESMMSHKSMRTGMMVSKTMSHRSMMPIPEMMAQTMTATMNHHMMLIPEKRKAQMTTEMMNHHS